MKNKVLEAVRNSLDLLLREDGCLFDCQIEQDPPCNARKLHEVCINHKLANYLEHTVLPILASEEKRFVDIEFNREGRNYKEVQINGCDSTLRPDIIIHNRKSGLEKRNFLVVECKKIGCTKEEIEEDKQKIIAFMVDDRYKYSFGLQVIYGKDQVTGFLFFKGDKGIDPEKIVVGRVE